MQNKHKSFLMAVAGPTASGKTTICSKLKDQLGESQCVVISCDNYYKDISHLSEKEINKTNFDHPDSIDFDLLIKHFEMLRSGQSINMPKYNFGTHAREKETVTIDPKPFIILEGILVSHVEKLRNLFDYRIYIETDTELALERRITRDTSQRSMSEEQVRTQFKETVLPMFKQFVEPSKKYAHAVIENSGQNLSFDVQGLTKKVVLAKMLGAPKRLERFSLFANPASHVPEVFVEPILKYASRL